MSIYEPEPEKYRDIGPIETGRRHARQLKGFDERIHGDTADQGRGPASERRKRYEAEGSMSTADIRGVEAIAIIVFIVAVVGAMLMLHWLVPGAQG